MIPIAMGWGHEGPPRTLVGVIGDLAAHVGKRWAAWMAALTALTRQEAELCQGLDRAAAALREARVRQERALWLCLFCHGPDGWHVDDCDGRR
jgi:cytochrome c553